MIGNFIQKLQSLPELDKKILFFGIIGLAILILGAFQVKSTVYSFGVIRDSIGPISLPSVSVPSETTTETVPSETTEPVPSENAVDTNSDTNNE